MPTEPNREETLFAAALRLPAAERTDFLPVPKPAATAVTVFTVYVCLGWLASLRADPLDLWRLRNPKVAALRGDYYALTYGGGVFVAVGLNIATSPDGKNWVYRDIGGPFALSAVAYGGGTFVATGRYDNGTGQVILTSLDGTTWTRLDSAPIFDPFMVVYGNGLFAAVSTQTVKTSTNGVDWVDRGPIGSLILDGITFLNGAFVVWAVDLISGNRVILTSTDAIIWTPHDTGSARRISDVAYGVGTFVVVGDPGTILTSEDAITWTPRSLEVQVPFQAVTFGNGRFVAVGGSGWIFTSTNGTSWTPQVSGTSSWLSDVVFENGIFLIIGEDTLLSSTDGLNWVLHAVTSQRLNSVAYGEGWFVAVGSHGTVLTSTNGANWTRLPPFGSGSLNSVAYDSGVFVAVGDIIARLQVGPFGDGFSWSGGPSERDFKAVSFVNGAFMAVGANGAIGSSDSGTTATLYGVTYGSGTYVVVGSGGTIRTSPDGATWTGRLSGTVEDLKGVTFADGIFLAHGNAGVILTSTDGAGWTPGKSGTGEILAASAYRDSHFIIVGSKGTILSSPDAVNWTNRNSGVSVGLWGITSGNGTFVAVGEDGAILQSGYVGPPRLTAPRLMSNGSFGLTASGELGQSYRLQATTSLGTPNWTDIASFTQTDESQSVQDPQAASHGIRFYRVIAP